MNGKTINCQLNQENTREEKRERREIGERKEREKRNERKGGGGKKLFRKEHLRLSPMIKR